MLCALATNERRSADACAQIAGFSAWCPAHCNLCGISETSKPDFVFVAVAVTIVVVLLACGIAFAVWAGVTRSRNTNRERHLVNTVGGQGTEAT